MSQPAFHSLRNLFRTLFNRNVYHRAKAAAVITVSAKHASTTTESTVTESPILKTKAVDETRSRKERYYEWLPLHEQYKAARKTIVLCHGLFGFDKLGFDSFPKLQFYYWGGIPEALRQLGCRVLVTKVPSTGTIAERAAAMNEFLSKTLEKNTEVNFLAHSMGGLDCRHLITHINPTTYHPISLTTLSTPHRGSSFMDFCRDYLGLGRISPKKSTTCKSSTKAYAGPLRPPISDEKVGELDVQKSLSSTILTHTMLARTLDTPAYANLTTSFLQNTFNPMTPDSSSVEYFSFGAVIPKPPPGQEDTGLPIWHPLYLPHKVVTEREGRENDGLVSLKSARWGKFVGQLACDHWDLRNGALAAVAEKRKESKGFDTLELWRGLSTFLYREGF